jgi:hypothetical protein
VLGQQLGQQFGTQQFGVAGAQADEAMGAGA